jgi:hypothetical protein
MDLSGRARIGLVYWIAAAENGTERHGSERRGSALTGMARIAGDRKGMDWFNGLEVSVAEVIGIDRHGPARIRTGPDWFIGLEDT